MITCPFDFMPPFFVSVGVQALGRPTLLQNTCSSRKRTLSFSLVVSAGAAVDTVQILV
jgi:hypothetical protein